MQSSKPSYGWSEMSAAELKKIPLPDRFLCRECKKFKSSSQFSNKQLNDYRFRVHRHLRVTNISAELRCRNCTGDHTQELHCTGPCSLWKGLEEFSKNQRRRPENAWCMNCTQWKEANEPGVTPEAPPNNLLSPDEEKEVVEAEAGVGAYTTDSIEGDADSDDEDVGFIYNSLASANITDNRIFENGRGSRAAGDSNATIPEYLTGHKKSANAAKTESSLSNPYEIRSDYTGVEGKQQFNNIASENCAPGNFAKGQTQLYDKGTGWAATADEKPKLGKVYNAWDNVGRVHHQYRAPSQSTTLTGSNEHISRPGSQTVSSGLGSGLIKEASAAGTPSSGLHRPDAKSNSSSQAGGWAKQTMATRNPAPQFPALSRPVKQNIYDDEDDSPDEI